jgi:hypothetical protein
MQLAKYAVEPLERSERRLRRKISKEDTNDGTQKRVLLMGIECRNGYITVKMTYADAGDRMVKSFIVSHVVSDKDEMRKWRIQDPEHATQMFPIYRDLMQHYVNELQVLSLVTIFRYK